MKNTNLYDGCGIINFNETKIPYKKIDGIIVTITSKENTEGEPRYSFFKGMILPCDINKLA